ncbi:hypothetical protein ES703_118226 [subsurface metagenome]
MGVRDAGAEHQDLSVDLIGYIALGNNGNIKVVQGQGHFFPGFPVVYQGDASPDGVQEAADSQSAATGPQDKGVLPDQILPCCGRIYFGRQGHYNTLKVDRLSSARRIPMIQNRITTRLSGQPDSSKW